MERLIRRTPEEKMEIIHLVEHSDLSIKKTLAELDVPVAPSTVGTIGIRKTVLMIW